MPGPSADSVWLVDTLRAAGDAALRVWTPGCTIRWKPDDSPVTAADLAAEAVLLDAIRARFPGEAIRSEEAGGSLADDGPTWVVDPIDGTSAFTEGLAHWGPSAARVRRTPAGTRLELGCTWLPRLGEAYVVEGGAGWLGDARLGPIADDTSANVVYLPSRFHSRASLDWGGKGRCLGGTAAHLALVARGAARAAIVAPGWAAWDTVVGLALIDAVGGVALRLADGAPLDAWRDEGQPFVAGTGTTAAQLVRPGVLLLHPRPVARGNPHDRP